MNQNELKKYQDIKAVRGLNYGSHNHAKDYYEYIKTILDNPKIKIVADLGCGTGEFVEWVRDSYKDKYAFGIDPVFAPTDKDYFLVGDSTSIPLDSVDLLTSFDVMEHICEEDLEKSVEEITRVSDFYITKIAYAPSWSKGVNGEDLHPLVRSEIWWKNYLGKYYQRIEEYNGLLICKNVIKKEINNG